MRFPIAMALGITVLASLPGAAQTERLPTTSRSQQQVQDLNTSMIRQQQQLRSTQQNQFEVNQLKSEIRRDSVSGGAPVTVPGGRVCPPGASGC